MPSVPKYPLRGEIWFAHLPTDPAAKGIRPVVIASVDARNRNERADSVLVVPLTTSVRGDAALMFFWQPAKQACSRTPRLARKIS